MKLSSSMNLILAAVLAISTPLMAQTPEERGLEISKEAKQRDLAGVICRPIC